MPIDEQPTNNMVNHRLAINKFCLNCALGKPLPLWKGMMDKPKPYLSLKDAFEVIKFTLNNNFFKNDVYNVLSENLTLMNIVKSFKYYNKKVKIAYHSSKLINQYPYMVSNQKFTSEAFKLKSKISSDIKDLSGNRLTSIKYSFKTLGLIAISFGNNASGQLGLGRGWVGAKEGLVVAW